MHLYDIVVKRDLVIHVLDKKVPLDQIVINEFLEFPLLMHIVSNVIYFNLCPKVSSHAITNHCIKYFCFFKCHCSSPEQLAVQCYLCEV